MEDSEMRTIVILRCLAAFGITLLALAPFVPAAAGSLALETEQAVSPGENVQISQGNCGALLVNIPEEGELTIESGVIPERKGIVLYKKACDLSYTGAKNQEITAYPSYLAYYINLDNDARFMWDRGDLGFYTYSGGKWTACNATLVSGGDHGRLVCSATSIGMFGLVNTHEEVEEPATERVKEAEGEPISAFGSLSLTAGRCSATLSNVPQSGFVDLENGCAVDCAKGLKFVHDVCKLSYTDAEERAIPFTRGYVTYSIRLAPEEHAFWEAGDLAFYIKNGNTWQACSATWISGGDHGSLVCTAQSVGGYGLVDTREKAVSDEE
jgi:hypothetical protein